MFSPNCKPILFTDPLDLLPRPGSGGARTPHPLELVPRPGSGGSRTPRAVEVRVEGQKVTLPDGVWFPEGHLGIEARDAVCTVTVKTGLPGKSGVNVVLRVELVAQPAFGNGGVRFQRTPEALKSWAAVPVNGASECDIGPLSARGSSGPRIPTPGSCKHEWSDDIGGEVLGGSTSSTNQLTPEIALSLGPESCSADFFHGLVLDVTATCLVNENGSAALRVEASGVLRLRPRLRPIGYDGIVRLYKAARAHYCAGEYAESTRHCEEALAMADALVSTGGARKVSSGRSSTLREAGDILNLLGLLHLQRSSPAAAVGFLQRALVIRQEHAVVGDLGVAATLSSLGTA